MSCLQMVGAYLVMSVVLGLIAAVGGIAAMFWFGAGFLLAALVFLWEVGRNAAIAQQDQAGSHE